MKFLGPDMDMLFKPFELGTLTGKIREMLEAQ
jgi:hypothetical protein